MKGIRVARADDAEAIARIEIAAWRAAYGSIMPADFLSTVDEAVRTESWSSRLGSAGQDRPTFVALDEAETVLGFCEIGPVNGDDLPSAGRAEVYGLYLAPAAWRRGIGSALLARAIEFWRPAAIRELILWVFEDNAPARAFYEAQGWRPDGARKLYTVGSLQPAGIRYRLPLEASNP